VKARKEYEQFVNGGIGKESIWGDVRGQAILGGEEFVDGLIDYLKKYKDKPEILKSQRYVNRPSLVKMFTEGILRDKGKRDKKIVEAVEKYGYRQREVADHLGMYFTSVSRIMRRE
jgi:putative transposase